ncbi:MAG TPA: DNA gyrase subunit A [Firmicutes bacterium]|nr:DNA gyrase subunit A [Bacillota bacterium]
MGDNLHGRIVPVRIEEEMKYSYLDYAMSVIVGRALPDVRDGLKPVHRRILFAMSGLGMTPDKPYKKSARLVGETLGKYHPHGDTAIYDAMVRLAQDFSSRYPLVDGHGNFGSIDGDSAAAMRYTEARMSRLALEMLRDIDKNTVDFVPNFNEEFEEPAVLPSRVPNLLINGSSGIAVGMATNIPPHNLGEVVDGLEMLIDNPDCTVSELMMAVKGPDFPTGGLILGRRGIKAAYTTGRGSIKVRAAAKIEEAKGGRYQIIVTQLPYQVNKARLIEKIADLVRDKKLEGISALRDESGREGIRIVIELKRDANAQVVLNRLYHQTQLQTTFGVIMLALVDGRPRVLNLKEVLEHYLQHQRDVIVRRTKFDLEKAEDRAHLLEGFRIALDHIDEIIALIRASRDTEKELRTQLMDKFALSEKQAQAILDMRLKRLSGLEREKIEEEYKELLKTINYLRSLLASPALVDQVIKTELLEVKDKFGDDRRTRITSEIGSLEPEDLIPEEKIVVTVTAEGYIKRQPVSVYRSQRRGGRGILGTATKDEDGVQHLLTVSNHDWLLFFTNRGLVHRVKGYRVPEAGRQAKGMPLVNFIALEGNEQVTAVLGVRDFTEGGYLVMATRNGTVKKTELSEYDTVRRGGLIAITLAEDDELIYVRRTDGNRELMLGTRSGKAIRFNEKDVRPMGRLAQGVRGIRLDPGDEVVSMDVPLAGAHLLVLCTNGYGKRTPISDFRPQKRGGKGLIAIRTSKRNGPVVEMRVVREDDDFMLITAGGVIIRIQARDIPIQGRTAQGVTIMKPDEDDEVVALSRVME